MPKLSAAADQPPAALNMFRLPMFAAMGELPIFEKLAPANSFAALRVLGDPKQLAELMEAIGRTIPDGMLLMAHGRTPAARSRSANSS